VMSADAATEVVTKMLFYTWVEGLASDGSWERISDPFEWCSVQWLKRAIPTKDWTKEPGTKVISGAETMREFVKGPDDVDI
jgi:hypothetical protein